MCKISVEKLKDVCKIGQGIKTCRYAGMGAGWECLKHTRLKCQIDKRVKANTFTAKGDNCEGIKKEKSPLTDDNSKT